MASGAKPAANPISHSVPQGLAYAEPPASAMLRQVGGDPRGAGPIGVAAVHELFLGELADGLQHREPCPVCPAAREVSREMTRN